MIQKSSETARARKSRNGIQQAKGARATAPDKSQRRAPPARSISGARIQGRASSSTAWTIPSAWLNATNAVAAA